MSSTPPGENGYGRARPRLPTGIVIISILVALVAVSGLIALLYRETRGPGEILRAFARAVDRGDCEGSYDLLYGGVRVQISEVDWCDGLSSVDELIDEDFEVEQAVLRGDQAEVTISGVRAHVWRLHRFGERSWRVAGPSPGGFLAGDEPDL